VMAKLRSPDGCPWDKEQDHDTLKRFLIEEAYEVIEAIENKDFVHLREELGDLLLQVVFHAQVAQEKDLFNLQDVIDEIHAKLLRRHPHVFKDALVHSSRDVEVQWEDIKRKEKNNKEKDKERSAIDGVPLAMPSTLQAVRLTEKAGRVGFDWKKTDDVIDKIDEELSELKHELKHGDKKKIEHELGDMLFAVCNLSRHLNMDPEEVHRKTLIRFRERFKLMEKFAAEKGKPLKDFNLDEQEKFWKQAKKILEK
ncbi:MAG: nucleoside triphosphate pyrophosphohydrolase, partial [Proteobacteria bacterium]|nr:nucleoside triphosphate pyrophosphohydrolase [Pseudomonadota bacterium]